MYMYSECELGQRNLSYYHDLSLFFQPRKRHHSSSSSGPGSSTTDLDPTMPEPSILSGPMQFSIDSYSARERKETPYGQKLARADSHRDADIARDESKVVPNEIYNSIIEGEESSSSSSEEEL